MIKTEYANDGILTTILLRRVDEDTFDLVLLTEKEQVLTAFAGVKMRPGDTCQIDLSAERADGA